MKAQWVHFTHDYDHRWPSRAVTAFKAGMKVYVKGEVAEAAFEVKAAKSIKKPDDDDEGRVSTPSTLESKRPKVLSGNPVRTNRVLTNVEEPVFTPAPPGDGAVSEAAGAVLSAAGGGEQAETPQQPVNDEPEGKTD